MTIAFFHAYGLILACAILLGWQAIQRKAREYPHLHTHLSSVAPWMCIGGILGARMYHVATDFHFYRDAFWQVFFISQGGLSVIGAFLGGLIALWMYQRFHPDVQWLAFLDLCVFGLPFAQALGRVGNFVNQELYGSPTSLPWAVFIDATHRPAAYQHFTHFHPLFAYEALALVVFGIWVWQKNPRVGSGGLFLRYVFYYALIRFVLDFLRLEKAMFFSTPLGVNQVFLLLILLFLSGYWIMFGRKTL